MAGNITLDNLVSVSELSHGGVSKTPGRVGNNNPIVVMRNNKPAAGVISRTSTADSPRPKRTSPCTSKPRNG